MINKTHCFLIAVVILLGCQSNKSLRVLRTHIETQPDSSAIFVNKKGDDFCIINFMKCDSCYYNGRYYGNEIFFVLEDTGNKDSIFSAIEDFCNGYGKKPLTGSRTMTINYHNDIQFATVFTDFYFFQILKIDPDAEFEFRLRKKGGPADGELYGD